MHDLILTCPMIILKVPSILSTVKLISSTLRLHCNHDGIHCVLGLFCFYHDDGVVRIQLVLEACEHLSLQEMMQRHF